MAAVEATDCAIEGTVSEASRDDGRPVRWGTPDGDMIVVGGMTRVSALGTLGAWTVSTLLLGMDFLLGVVALAEAAGLTALAGAVLAAGRLTSGLAFLTGALVATLAAAPWGVLAAVVLAAGLLLVGLAGADLVDLATVLTAFAVVLVAVLVFAGVAFTWRLLTELVCPWVVLSGLPQVDMRTRY